MNKNTGPTKKISLRSRRCQAGVGWMGQEEDT